MKRRTLLRSALFSPLAGTLRASGADTSSERLSGTRYQTYSRCLPDYLARLSKEAIQKREAVLSGLQSTSAIAQRQTWVRETLWTLIGGKPVKTELQPRLTGEIHQPGYRIEKLVYESRPGLFVTANLYIPAAGTGPFPAVLFQCGHYWAGKAYPSYQRCCQGLAQLGFVVLAFDPMGQGERINYLDETGAHSRLKEVDTEHTIPGLQYLLFGDSATRFQLWDAVRSVDLLLSRPEVDNIRVASVGHSGGATLTMLLAAADPRLAAAAVCMGNIENIAADPFLPPGATDDAEQDLFGAGALGMDRWDLFYPFAPKPMLIWPSDRDYYATYSPNYIHNAWLEYEKLRSIYKVLGRTDYLGWADTPLPHALAYRDRLLVYSWFSRWLKGNQEPVREEPPVKPLEPSALSVTPSGSVLRSFHSATPFSLLQSLGAERLSAPLPKVLGIEFPTSAECKRVAEVQTAHVKIEALEIRSEPEITLPAFLLSGVDVSRDAPVLLAFDERASDRLWFAPEADDVIASNCPVIVCTADLRGTGALTPQFSPGPASYEAEHEQEDNYAISSLFFGRPLVGQRVRDVLSLTIALRSMSSTSGRPIHMAAFGRLVFPAILAAALDPRIVTLYLSGGLAAFRLVQEAELPTEPFANYIPNWLNHTDIPELLTTLAPRKVVWAGPVDAVGATLPTDSVQALFHDALMKGHLSLRPAPAWSSEALLAQFA